MNAWTWSEVLSPLAGAIGQIATKQRRRDRRWAANEREARAFAVRVAYGNAQRNAARMTAIENALRMRPL